MIEFGDVLAQLFHVLVGDSALAKELEQASRVGLDLMLTQELLVLAGSLIAGRGRRQGKAGQ